MLTYRTIIFRKVLKCIQNVNIKNMTKIHKIE